MIDWWSGVHQCSRVHRLMDAMTNSVCPCWVPMLMLGVWFLAYLDKSGSQDPTPAQFREEVLWNSVQTGSLIGKLVLNLEPCASASISYIVHVLQAKFWSLSCLDSTQEPIGTTISVNACSNPFWQSSQIIILIGCGMFIDCMINTFEAVCDENIVVLFAMQACPCHPIALHWS